MNDSDIECTLYVVKDFEESQWLDVPLHVLRCIPLTEEARKNIIGSIELCNREMVIGKGQFVREIKEWNGINHQLKIRSHFVSEHNMMWHLYSVTQCNVGSLLPHPFEIGDKALTFPQLVSYRLVQERENQTITMRSWSRDTLMLNVEYKTGGGITLGIEPDGYCHS